MIPSTSTSPSREPVKAQLFGVRELRTMAPRESTSVGVNNRSDEPEMMRFAAKILANGGNKADVADFFYRGYGVRLSGYQPPVEAPGKTRGYSMNALQGLTFGFGDEAMGSILGMLTDGGAQAGRDDYRAELQKFNEQNPMSAMGAEIGGSLLLAPLMGPAVGQKMAGMGVGGRMAAGAGIGGAAGAAFGAGNASGGLSERAKGAVAGGALGVLFGGALPLAGAAVGVATKPVGRQLATWSEKLRNVPKDQTTASKAARAYWAEAITRDHGSIDNAIRKAEQLANTGAPVSLADIAGENGLGLVQAASGLRGPGKQKLVEELLTKQADQGDRLLGKLFRGLKVGLDNAYDASEELMANRKAASAPHFAQSFTEEATVTLELKRYLDNPIIRQAYEMARLRATGDDLAGIAAQGALKIPPLPETVTIGAKIPVRALHFIKLGIRDLATSNEASAKSLARGAAPSYYKIGSTIRDIAADQSPAYKKAIGIYADDTEAAEAIMRGKGGDAIVEGVSVLSKRFHQKAPELIKRELKELSPSNQELYRLGAVQDVAEWIAETTAQAPNAAKKLGGKEFGQSMSNIEQRVRSLFDDPNAADDFMDYVRAEARISRTTGSLGGSRTAPMAQQMAELTGSAPGSGGVVRQMAGATLTAVTQRARVGWTDSISDEISSLAVKGTRGKDELIAVLNSLRSHAPKYRPSVPIAIGQQASQLR